MLGIYVHELSAGLVRMRLGPVDNARVMDVSELYEDVVTKIGQCFCCVCLFET